MLWSVGEAVWVILTDSTRGAPAMTSSAAPSAWILRPPAGTRQRQAQEAAADSGQPAAPAVLPSSGAPVIARLSLLCFAPAGSSASVYHGWEQQLPAAVEVRRTAQHAALLPPARSLLASLHAAAADASDPTLQLLPVELPGRSTRLREAPLTDMQQLMG